MTEAEWLACEDPRPMLEALRAKKAIHRKLRLFACGVSRRLLPSMADERSRAAVEVAEKWADLHVTEVERQEAQRAAQEVWDCEGDHVAIQDKAAWVADMLVRGEFVGDAWVFQDDRWALLLASEIVEELGLQEQSVQACIVRDIFANPFRPVQLEPEWRTSTVTAIAQQMYESRDFTAMPILADALQDAGCENDDILTHCRDATAPHVRGCWVVDLVLGKS